jgi:hypothetical protein
MLRAASLRSREILDDLHRLLHHLEPFCAQASFCTEVLWADSAAFAAW